MATHLFIFLTVLRLIGTSSKDALDYMYPNFINGHQKVRFEPQLFRQSGQGYEKMRFRIFYDESMNKQPPEFKSLTQGAANFWSDALSVRPYEGTMFIQRNCDEPETVFTYSNESKKFEEHCPGPCAETTTCQDTDVPEEHLDECTYCSKTGAECHTTGQRGTGIENTDMVFYVYAIQTEECSATTIAYATPCSRDLELDRPIVAGINICPSAALQQLKKKSEVLLSTLKHEMMHTLGFDPSLYNYFRDSNGNPLVARDMTGKPTLKWLQGEFGPMVVKTVERQWHVRGGIVSLNKTFIVTPNVVREARAHFNCSELEGAELEDFGVGETPGKHWESRVYFDDAMTGSLGNKQQMSRIDLALLEDTGWYKVNYSLAEPMKYGKDLGCDFCMKSCKYWMDKKRREGKGVEPFCDQTEERSSNYLCQKTDKIYSGCPLVRKEDPVPKNHQYFDKLEGVTDDDVHFYSGIDMSADSCPIPLTGYVYNCFKQPTFEQLHSYILNPLGNIPLEGFGKDSYCFESRTNWTVKTYEDRCSQVKTVGRGQNVGCYKYLCLSGLLVIQILNMRFPCFFKGQVIEVNLFGLTGNATHEGTIVCPSCQQTCGQSSNFKCKPENQISAFKYSYASDECIDGDSLEKIIASLNKEGNKPTSSNDKQSTYYPPNQSSTLFPTQMIRYLLTFVVIKIFI